jgi:hypothetical protein
MEGRDRSMRQTREGWARFFVRLGLVLIGVMPFLYIGTATHLFPTSILARLVFTGAHGLAGLSFLLSARGKERLGLLLRITAIVLALAVLTLRA